MAERGENPCLPAVRLCRKGKTTLAKHFAEHVTATCCLRPSPEKRAQVLRSRGASKCQDHSLADLSPARRGGGGRRGNRQDFDCADVLDHRQSPVAKAALIVIGRMLDGRRALGRDLMSFGTPILDAGRSRPVATGLTAAAFSPIRSRIICSPRSIARRATTRSSARDAYPRGQGDHVWRFRRHRGVISKRRSDAGSRARGRSGAGRDQQDAAALQHASSGAQGFTVDYPQAGDKLVCLRNDQVKACSMARSGR